MGINAHEGMIPHVEIVMACALIAITSHGRYNVRTAPRYVENKLVVQINGAH